MLKFDTFHPTSLISVQPRKIMELNESSITSPDQGLKIFEAMKKFKVNQDLHSLSSLENLFSTQNEHSNEQTRNFLVKYYNFLRSPEFDQKSESYLRALSLCLKVGSMMTSRDEMDERTIAFLCRKISWIILKKENFGSLDLRMALDLGKECAVSLLKVNQSQMPRPGALREINGCLFELEVCRALSLIHTGKRFIREVLMRLLKHPIILEINCNIELYL